MLQYYSISNTGKLIIYYLSFTFNNKTCPQLGISTWPLIRFTYVAVLDHDPSLVNVIVASLHKIVNGIL